MAKITKKITMNFHYKPNLKYVKISAELLMFFKIKLGRKKTNKKDGNNV